MATAEERLLVLIEAQTKQFANAMAKVQKDVDRAMKGSGKAVDSLNRRLDSVTSTVKRVAAAFGVAFSTRALVNGITSAVKAGEAIGDTAEKLGISAEAFQELAFAATQAGTSEEALETAFKMMSKTLGEAERGSKAAQAEFARLGISFDDIRGKAPDQVFTLLLDRIGKIQDPLRRNAELLKMFGKSGLEMAQMAKIGGDGVDELREKARALGIVLSNETIRKAQDAGDTLDTLGAVAKTVGVNLAVEFMPAFKALADIVTSPEFQAGVKATAENIASIIQWMGRNPEALKALTAMAVAWKVGGPVAAVGVGAGMAWFGENTSTAADDQPFPSDQAAIEFYRARRAGSRVNVSPPGYVQPKTTSDLLAALGMKSGTGGGAGTAGTGGGWITPGAEDAAERQKKRYDDLTRSLQLQIAELKMNNREQAIANEVARLGAEATEQQKGAIAALTGKLYDQRLATERAVAATNFFAETAAGAFDQLIPKIETGNAALDHMINALIQAGTQALFLGQGPLANLFGLAPTGAGPGGIFGALFGGFFAGGGMLGAGKWGIAGERGPEIVKGPAMISPMAGGAGGGRVVIEAVPNPYFDIRVREVAGPIAFDTTRAGLGAFDRNRQRAALK